MPIWESIVTQKEWICRVQWLVLRSRCLQFICLGRVYCGPDTVWFNWTPPISKLGAGTVILGCIFWQSRDDQEIHCKTTLRSELELSCSSTLEVSITPWVHQHFTSQLPRFLGVGILCSVVQAFPSRYFSSYIGKATSTAGEQRKMLEIPEGLRDPVRYHSKIWKILSSIQDSAVLVCFCKICLIL